MPEQLGTLFHLMSDDIGDHPVMIALPPGRAHAAISLRLPRSLNERPCRSLVWYGSNTPVMQGWHIRAQSKSERAASFPGVVPVGPCMCCLSFSSRRRRPGYCCPYTFTGFVAMLRERPHLGHSVVSPLWACHHASHIASDSPGPVSKSSFVVEHELRQESRSPQENHQRALGEIKQEV